MSRYGDDWYGGYCRPRDFRSSDYQILQDLKDKLSDIARIQQEHTDSLKILTAKVESTEKKVEDLLSKPVPVGTNSCASSKEAIPLSIVQDIFDIEFASELKEKCATTMWSDVESDLKTKMVECMKANLIIENMKVPSDKMLLNRLKGFYSNRRTSILASNSEDKKKKRKLSAKASRLTYNARQEAVKQAIGDGKLDPKDKEKVKKFRMDIPQIILSSASSSDEDEEAVKQKKLQNLGKARNVKKKKRENALVPAVRSRPNIKKVAMIEDDNDSILAPDSMSPRPSLMMDRYKKMVPNKQFMMQYEDDDDDDETQLPYGYENKYMF